MVLPPWRVHGRKSSESGPPALAKKIHARTHTRLAAMDTKDLHVPGVPQLVKAELTLNLNFKPSGSKDCVLYPS